VLVVKNLPANARDSKRHWFDPWVRKSLGGGHGNPFQHSCLENPNEQRSLTGYRPLSYKDLDMNEPNEHTCMHI